MRIRPIVIVTGLALATAGCASFGTSVLTTASIGSTQSIIPDAIPGPPLAAGVRDLDRAPDIQDRVYTFDPDSPDFWYPRW
jgi:hypothetical protein